MTRSLLVLFVLLLSITLFPASLSAQIWQHLGPRSEGTVRRIHVDSRGNIFAVSNHVHVSRDDGQSWEYVMRDGAPIKSEDFAIDSNDNILAIVEGERLQSFTNGYLLRSSDLGTTWEVLSDSTYAILPTKSIYYAGVWGGINRSTDRGITWERTTLMAYPTIADQGGAAYASLSDSVFRSVNDGITWEKYVAPGSVSRLAVVGDEVYVNTERGVFKSKVGSHVWGEVVFASAFNNFFIAQIEGDTLYAVCPSHLVFRSFDKGETWHEFYEGLPFDVFLQEMVQDRKGRLLIGSYDGIYRNTLETSDVAVAPDSDVGDPIEIVTSPGRVSIRNIDALEGEISFTLYDMLGREVLSERIDARFGNANVELSPDLHGGFFVQLHDDSRRTIAVRLVSL